MNNLQEYQQYKESLQNHKILPKLDRIKIKVFFLLLKLLDFLFPNSNVHKFENSLKFYLGLIDINIVDWNSQQKPTLFLYLGLTSKPWYQPDDYDVFKIVTNTLEEGAKEIKDELLMNISNKNNFTPVIDPSDGSIYEHLTDIELPASHKKDDWLLFRLWLDGKFTQKARYLFPKTVNILSKLESFIDPFEDVYFLVLKPGVVLPPHHDTSNVYITCQLGLMIPESCGIRVGSEMRSWTEGKTLFFDQSFEHEAWNKSQKERVVLLVHLRHPELSKFENFLYEFFCKAL
ncbi:MAG: aspartyl/asparaginyl beta-hydroxylase domain-containing protein [Pelatocladus maniniholoensis HA4357-MV3]|uniref:Aspartyl/asparaginyl beta-hydroxylase domain-containing protein n=1 Tax=Pelatocladus maniniholoensis HA4357-MV3 TaxID=1117104 RepID=A0A9E3H6K3_9NOST|nr:aspartyl/asparaginyl beta-hydroxylase domain-containing protein [Pelatocladus maniniholoensis HA4357-MV3]